MKINDIIAKKAAIALKYPSQESTIDILFQNIDIEFNTILYGSGGYGKSDIIKDVCKALDLPVIVVQCNRNMAKEELIGALDISKYIREAKYRVNFNDSPFMKEGILVLEEFMDINPETAVVIKDILSEKGNRVQDNFTPYKIKAIVATGNKSPSELAYSESLKALFLERFDSHIDMTWEVHSPEKYIQLFKYRYTHISDELNFTAIICSEIKASPRTALKAAKLITKTKSLPSLGTLHSFKKVELDRLIYLHHENINQ